MLLTPSATRQYLATESQESEVDIDDDDNNVFGQDNVLDQTDSNPVQPLQPVQINFRQVNDDVEEEDEQVKQVDEEEAIVLNELNMAEERALLPIPSRGTSEEDAGEFWRRLNTYDTYKVMMITQNSVLLKQCLWKGRVADRKFRRG